MADNKPKSLGQTLLDDIKNLGNLFDGVATQAKKLDKVLASDEDEENTNKDDDNG